MASVAHIIRRRRRRRAHKTATHDRNRNLTLMMLLLGALIVLAPVSIIVGSVAAAYSRAVDVLPEPRDTIFLDPIIGPTQIFDAQAETLLFSVSDPLGDQRTWVDLETLPQYVIDATILWEDPDYFATGAFSAVAAFNKLVENRVDGPLEAETSLTARLVRNVILPPRDFVTINQRADEIALIAEIHRLHSLDDILEWHLNTNYYGNEAYGIDAAAQVYLGKAASDLTLDEAALLATIPTAPRFNPVDDEAAARSRQADLLRLLLTNSYITQAEYQNASTNYTAIRPDAGQTPLVAPEFAIYARRQAETILDALGENGAELVSRGGLRITTTLDLDLYYQSECVLRAHLAQLSGDVATASTVTALDGGDCVSAAYLPNVEVAGEVPPDSGALVLLDVNTGVVKAITGQGTRARYQPGPALYPFVYLAGMLDASYTPASMLLDIPQSFPGAAAGLRYLADNNDGEYRGPMSLREAMGAGLRPPVMQVANSLSINRVLREAAFPLGITSLDPATLDLALLETGGAVSVLEMTQAYAVFAAMGDIFDFRRLLPGGGANLQRQPIAIRRIEDANGVLLWEYNPAIGQSSLLQSEAAYVINDILGDDSTRWNTLGQGNILEITRPAAVNAGITADRADNWTIGYTPHLVTGVRIGRGDGASTSLQGFAANGAPAVWRAVTEYAHIRDGLPPDAWPRPSDIGETLVCEISGLAPNGVCETRPEIFISANQAQTLPEDTFWVEVEINTDNNLLTTVNTQDALRRKVTYFVPPDEALDWWQLENLPLPPTQFDTSLPDEFRRGQAAITNLVASDVVGGLVEIRGSMNSTELDFYQVAYGETVNPATWTNITDRITEFNPQSNTLLTTWDTANLNGPYTIRLQVTLEDGTFDDAFVFVIVDNVAPTVVLQTDDAPGKIYRWPEDDTIPLVAQVTEQFMSRVEFYHNGQRVGIDEQPPYAWDFEITGTGSESFVAVAVDQVGNLTESLPLDVDVLRSSN